MASTYTPLGIELQATGENAGTWGTKTNTNLSIVEQISGGFTQQSIAGGAQTTALSVSDGSTGATLAHRMIELTGTITGNQIVTIPIDVQTFYFLRNSTSGAYTVQFKYASGSGDSFTFATTDKGTKILFASANDGTNPDIIDIGMGDVTLTGTQTLTNKTLTSPKIGTSILDTNGNELALLTATSSAVNEFTIANAATGNDPTLSATGDDSNIDLAIKPKGTGETVVGTGAADATITSSGAHNLILDTNSGTNSGTITITDAANGNIAIAPNGSGAVVLDGLSWPTSDGTANYVLKTDGSASLSWTEMAGGTDWQAVQSTGFTAAAGKGYFCNTSSAAFTVTLPASPSLGDEVSIVDYSGTADTNNITVGRNSLKIMGSAADLTVAIERAAFTLVYSDSTYGWLLKDK